MPVRAVEGKLPYTGGEAISIDENKVISLNLRDENNLIIYDQGDDEIYVDLQLPAGIKPNYAFPVGVTTGRVLIADDWDVTGTILVAKTTSGDVIKLLYGDDGTLWMDNGTGLFKQIYFKSDVDVIITTLTTYINTELAKKQDKLTAGTGINISQNNEISNALPGAVVSATAPSNPSQGAMWYDTTTDTLMTYDGSQWNATGGGGSGDVVVSTQTGNVLTSGMSIWAGSQSDYENLSEYNENCLYLTIEGVDGPRTYSYDFTDKTSTQVTNDGWSALDNVTSWSVDSNGLTVTGYAGYMKKEIDNSNFSNANKITLSYHCKTTSSTSYSINVYLGDVTGSTINHSLFMNFDCRQGFRQFGYDSTEIAKVYGGTYGEHDITIVLDLVNKTYTWSLTGQTDMTGTLADAYITSIRNDFNCIGLGCYGSSIVYRDVSIEIEH